MHPTAGHNTVVRQGQICNEPSNQSTCSKAVRLDAAQYNVSFARLALVVRAEARYNLLAIVHLHCLIANSVGLTTSTINAWTGLHNFH